MTLNHLKVSILWFEPLKGLLAERAGREPGRPAAVRALSRASTYQELFDQLRRENARKENPFTLPWRADTLSYFWRYYLDCNPPDRVSAWEAWDRLVPLRRGAEILEREGKVQVSGAGDNRFQIESFHYPHGIGVVATVTMEDSLELKAAVNRVHEVLRGQVLQVSDPAHPGRKSVAQLAKSVLDGLGQEAFGEDLAQAGSLRTDPFSITTVLSGDAPPAWTRGEPPVELRQALQRICTGDSERWKGSLLKPCIRRLRHRRGLEDLLFGVGRGRAVWFPSRFVPSGSKNRSLGCYHRNLTLASLQTESLLQLARITADQLDTTTPPLPIRWEEVARRGARLLGGLYAGRGSYASWSILTQIQNDKELLRKANRVRGYFGLPELRRAHPEKTEALPPPLAGEPGEVPQEAPASAPR